MSERTPPSDRLRRMASDYEEAVTEARSEQLAARALTRARTIGPARRRLTVALAGASLLFVVVLLGATSASSLPGDPLYGVSRAYESVGGWVGVVDPVEQRLYEVIVLADRGDVARAAQAAEEALEELERTGDVWIMVPSASTTTTSPQAEDGETTPADPPPDVTADASTDETDTDPISTLRLAAELLLNRVQNNGGELEAAAAGLADAVSDLVIEEEPVIDTTSTTTTPTTSTTLPEDTASTTTIPDPTTTTEPDSTSTTLPEEDASDDGPGPIFIPPGF